MEELIIIFLQAIIELFINIPWDYFFYSEGRSEENKAFTIGFLSLFIGALIGALSVAIFPDVLTKQVWLRIMLLFAGPPFGGLVAYKIAKIKSQTRLYVNPTHHFWWSFLFSLGYMVVRFAWAHRPI